MSLLTESVATVELATARPTVIRDARRSLLPQNYATLLGLLAVREADDGLPGRAPRLARDELAAQVDELIEYGVLKLRPRERSGANAEVDDSGTPLMADAQRREWISETLRELLDKLQHELGRSRDLVIRDAQAIEIAHELVRIDLLEAADTLRALRRLVAGASEVDTSRASVAALAERAKSAGDAFRAAHTSGSLPRPWLTHVKRALTAGLIEAHRLSILVSDLSFPDPAALADVEASAAALQELGDEAGALVGLIKASTDEARLSTVGDRAAEYVERYGKSGTALDTKDEAAISEALQQQWRRMRSRAGHELASAQEWVARDDLVAELDAFWQEQGGGVFAVIGIGGAGKTALVSRLLEVNDWLSTSYSAGGPDGIFIWSCYDSDSVSDLVATASRFFERYLTVGQRRALGDSPPTDVSRLVETLRRATGRYLVVLDGLERLQVEAHSLPRPAGISQVSSGGFGLGYTRGEFEDPAVARLLKFIARNTVVKVIATSREPLATLAADPGYRERDVTKMDDRSAASLLASRGVQGDTEALAELANQFDNHALTLWIVGGWLKLHHRGDPAAVALLQDVRSIPGEDDFARAVRKLNAVLNDVLTQLDETEAELLNVVAALSIPFPLHLLSRIVQQRAKQRGSAVPAPAMIDKSIGTLAVRGLTSSGTEQHGDETLFSHVLVRSFYYGQLAPEDKRSLHELINRELNDVIAALPKENADRGVLIRERFRQLVALGRYEEAYEVYRTDLGGYLGLGWREGKHHDGARLMQMFIEGDVQDRNLKHRATLDGVLHIKNLGLLDEAAAVLERLEIEEAGDLHEHAADSAHNLAGIYLMRGRLRDALQAARRATGYAEQGQDHDYLREAFARLADVAVRVGDASTAQVAHEKVLAYYEPNAHVLQLPGLSIAWLSLLQENWQAASEAVAFARAALESREQTRGSSLGMLRARLEAVRAGVAVHFRDLDGALAARDYLYEWALAQSSDQEMVAVAHLTAGRVARAESQLDAAEQAFRIAEEVAREGGLGLHWIDAKVEQAALAVQNGLPAEGIDHANMALAGLTETTDPGIIGAGAPPPAYRWGALFAHRARRDAYVLEGAAEQAIAAGEEVQRLEKELGVVSAAVTADA